MDSYARTSLALLMSAVSNHVRERLSLMFLALRLAIVEKLHGPNGLNLQTLCYC